jgi:hypothetical protein
MAAQATASTRTTPATTAGHIISRCFIVDPCIDRHEPIFSRSSLSQAEIAAAESVFQARPIASKIYDHSKRMKEKRVVPKVRAVGRGLDSHTLTPRAFAG